MALIMADFTVQQTITEVLTAIRNDNTTIEFLFSEFKKSFLGDVFGEKEIDSIREYIKKDLIKVVSAFRMIDTTYPCYSVQLISMEEMDAEAALDDFKDEEYLDSNGNEVNKNPSSLDFPEVIPDSVSKVDVFTSPIREQLLISCTSTDPNITRYLSWLLLYMLRSNKNTLIDRGLDRISMSFSDFNRLEQLLPENVFGRFCSFSCVHYLEFSQNDLLLNSLNVQVKGQIKGSKGIPGTTNKALPANATFITIE